MGRSPPPSRGRASGLNLTGIRGCIMADLGERVAALQQRMVQLRGFL
jgi:hypothetical protein